MTLRKSLVWFCVFPAFTALLCSPPLAAWLLCKSANHPIPALHDSIAERVSLRGGDKETAAWFLAGSTSKAMILAHGIGSDRNSMLPRAVWLRSLGYSVAAVDLHAHGETPGARKTFGILEAGDIMNAYAFLKREKGAVWIGGLGTSLGGASMLKAAADGVPFDALILESVFADIRTAARNRMEIRFGPLGRILEPALTLQLPFWIGYPREVLRPVDWARKCICPVLLLTGSEDDRARVQESEALLENLAGPNNRMVVVRGVGHVDLFQAKGTEYVQEVELFLSSHK